MRRMISGCVLLALALVSPVTAQEVQVPARTAPALVPLKLQLVLSRYQGEKKISSIPYSLWLTANETGERTSLRMGVEVPIGSTEKGFNYRSVGTNIDCIARVAADGFYRLHLTVVDSSVFYGGQGGQQDPAFQTITRAAPSFRSFTANFVILLRDHQSGQYTSATDPVSGEVLKIDATLDVMK